ncbi:putative membrane protein [Streptococcus pneumoniae GA41565]|nr:putative membrane protein [Streptococcus pneumoniae GA41565]EJG45415.1 cytochrome c-type biogenesis protein CcdA [Streptococcus pneumoniae 2070335]
MFGRKVLWSGLIRTLCFIAGISLIFFILGFGAGYFGHILYANWFRYVMGAIIIILGLHQMEIFHLKKLEVQKVLPLKNQILIVIGQLFYLVLPLALVGHLVLVQF